MPWRGKQNRDILWLGAIWFINLAVVHQASQHIFCNSTLHIQYTFKVFFPCASFSSAYWRGWLVSSSVVYADVTLLLFSCFIFLKKSSCWWRLMSSSIPCIVSSIHFSLSPLLPSSPSCRGPHTLYSENLCVARCRHDYGLRTLLAEEVKGQMSIVTVFTRRFGPI